MLNLNLKSMKNLFTKFATPLLLLLFVFGIAHFSMAAFPGKQHQSKEITTVKSNVDAAAAKESKKSSPVDEDIVLLVILCFLLPPLAVYLKYNDTGKPFVVNIILTLLCGLPGIIHALVHVLRK